MTADSAWLLIAGLFWGLIAIQFAVRRHATNEGSTISISTPGLALTTIGTALSLSGCVTARMHTQVELNDIGQKCGLALGELFQDESEKRLVFLFRPDSTPQERACVARWAKKNGLKAVFVNAVNLPAS
jgi:hypothetical protein